MAYGNDGGLVLVDVVQKSVLLSMASVDLYSSADPYTRLPRSPKRPTDSANSKAEPDDSCRQISGDQVREKIIRDEGKNLNLIRLFELGGMFGTGSS